MKKSFALFFFILLLMAAPPVFAAESVTVAVQNITKDASVRTVTFSWTASASGALATYSTDLITITSSTGPSGKLTNLVQGYYILTAETKPGATAPTAYSITLKDSLGLDRMGALLSSLSTSTAQMFNAGTVSWGYTPINGPLLFNLTGNTTPSAKGTLVLTLLYAGNTVPAQP